MADDRWPISAGDYIKDASEAESFLGRLQPWDLLTDNVKGLVLVVGGLFGAAAQAIPNSLTKLLDAIGSFAVDVVDHLFAFPQTSLRTGFVEGVVSIGNSGAAGVVAATLIVGASAVVVAKGVDVIVSGGG